MARRKCGQGEVSGGVLQVISMIGIIMEVIRQLLGEMVTARVSANSCLHLGGRSGLWSGKLKLSKSAVYSVFFLLSVFKLRHSIEL